MSEVWIVIEEDRRADVNALPFSTQELACEFARKRAEGNAGSHDGVYWGHGLTPGMVEEGWVLYLPYGGGDCVRVVRRTMDLDDAEPPERS